MRVFKTLLIMIFGALLIVSFQNCSPPDHEYEFASSNVQSVLFNKNCVDPSAMAVRDSQRLNRTQYINVLTDIFGPSAVSSLSAILVNYADDTLYEKPSQYNPSFDQSKIDVVFDVAKALGSYAANSAATQQKMGAACLSAALPTTDCYEQLITNLGLKAFRRPLTAVQLAALKDIVNTGTTKSQKIGGVIEALLQSPQFLYQVSIGTEITNDLVSLSAYEVAERLSFLIWDSIPDATLFALAASGEILNPDVQRQQVDRMFKDSRARAKISNFALYWLGQKSSHAMSVFPSSPPSYVAGLNPNLLRTETLRELQEFVQYEVIDKNATFKDLLTSTDSFARTDDLASIFGHAKVTGSLPTQMTDGRRGVLMRPIFLANESSTPSSILRGVRIRARIFCGQLGAPPAGAEAEGIDITSVENIRRYSNRELITMKTSGGSCMGCHSQANPIGFAFGNLDSFGRFQTYEKIYQYGGGDDSLIATHPIDTTASPSSGWGETWSVSGPEDFVQKIAESQTGVACFSRHVYEFLQVQNEEKEDACLMQNVIEKVSNPDQGVLEAMKQVILSNYLSKKKIN